MCYSNPDSNWNRSLCQSCMSMHIMNETWVYTQLCFHVRSPRKHLSGSNLRAFRIPFICTRSVFHFLFFLSLKSGYLHNKRRAHDDEYAERLRRTDSHTLFATLAANKQARQDQCEHLKPRRGTEIDRVLIFNVQSSEKVMSVWNTGQQIACKRSWNGGRDDSRTVSRELRDRILFRGRCMFFL